MPVPDFHEFDDCIGDIGTVGEFWRWAMSDMVGNRNRGILAEYIVGKLLGADLSQPRLEWDCYDLLYDAYKIEVKSSAYIQTWHNLKDQRSSLSFGIAPHTCWDARNNRWSNEKKRWADVYVFCVFPADRQSDTRDVLDLNQWRFYVTTTRQLEANLSPNTRTIGIARVRDICGNAVCHMDLKAAVNRLLD